uniref:Uncharacterized protein n=1 Tax=uncultured marine virus TaxID=186617 RepID=A0A0F7L4N5_9VIRU|nr:hypothetical protein [uncultured marine virus]
MSFSITAPPPRSSIVKSLVKSIPLPLIINDYSKRTYGKNNNPENTNKNLINKWHFRIYNAAGKK